MKLNREAGILFAVPIPKQHSAAGNLIESATQRALTEARSKEENISFICACIRILKRDLHLLFLLYLLGSEFGFGQGTKRNRKRRNSILASTGK